MTTDHAELAMLQWGHGLAAVESRGAYLQGAYLQEALQWGHGLAAVERRSLWSLCRKP